MLIACYQNMGERPSITAASCRVLKTLMASGPFALPLCERLSILRIILPTG